MPRTTYNVAYAREERNFGTGEVKQHWTTIGIAWQSDKGSIHVKLNALPLPQAWPDGSFVLFPKT